MKIPNKFNRLGIDITPYKRKLTCLKSTGTQYIDTGIKPDFTQNDEIYISFYGAEYSGAAPCIMGSRETGLKNGVYALAGGAVTVLNDETYKSYPIQYLGNQWLKVSNQKIITDSRNYDTDIVPVCGLNIYLFALNNYGTGAYGIYSGLKIYEWKYYQNGVLKQHLIPVLDNNNIPCMYDTVSDNFYYNVGTGNFDYE